MDDVKKNIINKLDSLFTSIDEVISNWTGTDNLQFPVLLGMMSVKMGWDEKQVRENDPMVRYYIRNNPAWFVTRGAKGGIMRASDKQKKESLKVAKDVAKQQIQEALEARLKSNNQLTDVKLSPSDNPELDQEFDHNLLEDDTND